MTRMTMVLRRERMEGGTESGMATAITVELLLEMEMEMEIGIASMAWHGFCTIRTRYTTLLYE
jgi:hypothetical protein